MGSAVCMRSVAPLLGIRDPRTGARGPAREVFPPAGGRGVPDVVGCVVPFERALALARHLAEDAHVAVAHGRARSGSGTGTDTATAWGSSCGRSSGPNRSKPKLLSELVS